MEQIEIDKLYSFEWKQKALEMIMSYYDLYCQWMNEERGVTDGNQ